MGSIQVGYGLIEIQTHQHCSQTKYGDDFNRKKRTYLFEVLVAKVDFDLADEVAIDPPTEVVSEKLSESSKFLRV